MVTLFPPTSEAGVEMTKPSSMRKLFRFSDAPLKLSLDRIHERSYPGLRLKVETSVLTFTEKLLRLLC